MNKTFLETQLQLLLSPVLLHAADVLQRPPTSAHLQQGFMILSALQVRGHFLFSQVGRRPDEETLEYGWMIEAVLGQLTGRLTLPQLQHVVAGLETFLQLGLDEENQLSRPINQVPCHHGATQLQCVHSTQNGPEPSSLGTLCPTSEDIKYKMTRVSLDVLDVTLVESGTALGLQVFPVRLSTCNLHSRQTHSGLSMLIPNVRVHQYLATARSPTIENSYTALNNSGRSKSEPFVKISGSSSTWNRVACENGVAPSAEELYVDETKIQPEASTSNRIDMDAGWSPRTDWLEVGLIEMGPIYIDIGSSMDHYRVDLPALQNVFLKVHDNRTRRLWFLWDPLSDMEAQPNTTGPSGQQYLGAKCGCNGGCAFFGKNCNGRAFFECGESGLYPAFANASRRTNDLAFGQSLLHPNVFLVDLLDLTVEEPTDPSDQSNTSTIKQINPASVESDYFHVVDGCSGGTGLQQSPQEEIRSSPVAIQPRTASRRSLLSLQAERRVERVLKRCRSSTVSTPTLAGGARDTSSSPVYTSVLPDVVSGSLRSLSSRVNRSESHSELYFSAEDEDPDNTVGDVRCEDLVEEEAESSTSDELLSLSMHLPSRSNQLAVDGKDEVQLPGRRRRNSLDSVSTISSSSLLSSSRAGSDMSFNSALSSAADFSLVDLHLQTARPVVESPILFASYITHLSKSQCTNWSQAPPKSPSQLKSKCTPKFVTTKKGFTAFRLVDRQVFTPGVTNGPGTSGGGTANKAFAFSPQKTDDKATNFWDGIQEEKNGLRNDATTVFVKIDRCINVMFCPLTLESAQRFTEALVPTLELMHPLSVMGRIHSRCIAHVESHNPLKKERTTLLEQKEPKETIYQQVTNYHVRGSLQIPRVNLCLLQAGIVEQVISLSALDNPHDLVCVSTAAICVDALALHFSKSVQEHRIVQAVSRPATETNPTKKVKSKTRQGNSIATEVVFVESSSIDNEQLMISGTLGKIHLQLRRLNNDVTHQLPDNVTATVIPTSCSRVLFNYSCDHIPETTTAGSASTTADSVTGQMPNQDEELYGIVMFECGVQGLNLRSVKRVSNAQDKTTTVTVEVETASNQNVPVDEQQTRPQVPLNPMEQHHLEQQQIQHEHQQFQEGQPQTPQQVPLQQQDLFIQVQQQQGPQPQLQQQQQQQQEEQQQQYQQSESLEHAPKSQSEIRLLSLQFRLLRFQSDKFSKKDC